MNADQVLMKMTEKQRHAWMLRYVHDWPLKRIALRVGGTRSSVSELLSRARANAGLSKPVRAHRQTIRAASLSSTYNY